MKKILFICTLLFAVSSCNFTEPEVSGYSNFKFGKLEGKTLNVSFDATVNNENRYGFKVKTGMLTVSVNNLEIGVIDLDKKIRIRKKSENVYTVPLQLSLSDGALFRIPKLLNAGKFELRLDGNVRGSIWGFGKNFEVHETRNLSTGDIKFDGLLEGIMKSANRN
ncbi:LEA type 2 family protein [Fluviicola sp.]|jgi:LEA14-like dessication related protein|uniref:LEA type 2 family protein n=1 Tax=Fluviicola sp. TaxID=1917219 RepID=UPI002821AD88|nr:LEA type 2 family protein [Fluviicola sp.]MDR0802274.1 LEA type 2 family protein [Fluviicola sp.]